jgi:hypothetical protein
MCLKHWYPVQDYAVLQPKRLDYKPGHENIKFVVVNIIVVIVNIVIIVVIGFFVLVSVVVTIIFIKFVKSSDF